jgi:predicted HTH transcriptional regulator
MRGVVERQLTQEIETYQKNFADDLSMELEKTLEKTSDKVVALLRENPRHSARTLAAAIGISAKGVEKQLAKLKASGKITRVGSAKGGSWQVN